MGKLSKDRKSWSSRTNDRVRNNLERLLCVGVFRLIRFCCRQGTQATYSRCRSGKRIRAHESAHHAGCPCLALIQFCCHSIKGKWTQSSSFNWCPEPQIASPAWSHCKLREERERVCVSFTNWNSSVSFCYDVSLYLRLKTILFYFQKRHSNVESSLPPYPWGMSDSFTERFPSFPH